MAHTIRSSLLFSFVVALGCASVQAEDVKLRENAVNLIERANALSLVGGFRDYEQVVTFTFHDLLTGSTKSRRRIQL